MVKILGFVLFPAFRTPRDQGFCKCALPSLLLGENQQHSIAGALCSTIYLAYLGTRHLIMTMGEKKAYFSSHCLYTCKKIQTRKLQNIWGTNEVVTALAPPIDLDKQLHTDSWGKAGLCKEILILSVSSMYSLCVGPQEAKVDSS